MEMITRSGRATRVVVTAAVFALLLAGSAWGSDDDFPFGPFSMYAGVNGPNDPAPDLRVEATNVDGRTIILTERNAGLRRAEIEGQEAAYIADPSRLGALADAYQRLNPQAAPIVKVAMIVRFHEIRDSRTTGAWHDEVTAVWERGST
jgi:hypothetical protein